MVKGSEIATGAIVEQANEWLVRLQDPASDRSDAAEFTRWLQRSPVHVREYLRAESTWGDLGEVDQGRRFDVDALLREDDSNVIALESAVSNSFQTTRPAAFVRRLSGPIAAALVIVGIFVGTIWYLDQQETSVYATARGEQRRLVLADGSTIDMNTESEIRVRLTTELRDIEFIKGEALFTVAKDEERPFVVKSDLAVVRALGTQFNVYRQSNQVVVTVLEGRVAVETATREETSGAGVGETPSVTSRSVELSAGDRAEIVASSAIKTATANTERTLAWRERRLIFEDQPLSGVVAEFNRYNLQQLVIHDPDLKKKRIDGVFDADHPDALVRFLAQNARIETVQVSRSELLIRVRK